MTDAAKRWHPWAAAALLAWHAALAWVIRSSPAVTVHSDEATYILLARALRQLSYRETFLIDAPVHAQYPPAFPAFLATLSLPFGERFDVLIAGIIAASVLALALLYDVVRRRSGVWVALGVLALSALNPGLLVSASKPFSEPLFMLFSFATLWAVGREADDDGAHQRRWAIIAGATAIGAALTRSAGVTLVLALFVVWVLERRYRRAAWFATSATATVGSWLAWTVLAPVKFVGRSYVADAAVVAPGAASSNAAVTFAATLAARAWHNGTAYISRHTPWAMATPTLSGTIVDNVLVLLLLVGLCGSGMWFLRRKLPLVVAYLLIYGALLIAWPWDGQRFVVPVVPLLFWAMIEGASGLAQRTRWLTPLPVIAAIALIATAIVRDVAIANDARACFRADARMSDACFPAVNRGSFRAADFLRDSTPRSTVVVSGNEALLAYQSERPVLSSLAIGGRTPSATFALMQRRNAEYVLLTWLREPAPQLVPTLTDGCRSLEVVREYERTLLLRLVTPGVSPAGGDACDALARYAANAVDRSRTIR